jgi:hypothetical protein
MYLNLTQARLLCRRMGLSDKAITRLQLRPNMEESAVRTLPAFTSTTPNGEGTSLSKSPALQVQANEHNRTRRPYGCRHTTHSV